MLCQWVAGRRLCVFACYNYLTKLMEAGGSCTLPMMVKSTLTMQNEKGKDEKEKQRQCSI